MMEIVGMETKRRTIDVTGMLGTFETKNKEIIINYFSTFANAKDPGSGEYALLEQLSPMREKVNPGELKDLNSLLQRDLNDQRVSSELIPYLLGKISDIVFFPAILGVLIPKDFLEEKTTKYPTKKIDKSNETKTKIDFDGYWTVEKYRVKTENGFNDSNLGMLKIDEAKTEIIVLDGQHRANAFRVVGGVFFETNKNELYSAFYKEDQTIKKYMADLPVTLIWFENKQAKNKTIDPALISRRLFVDVNNTARKVSEARTILLNDNEIDSLLTRFFYSYLARVKTFKAEVFSLLHSAFDIDSDIVEGTINKFSLTTPQFIHDIFYWLLFGTRHYHKLDVYQVTRTSKAHLIEFEEVFGDGEFTQKDINYTEKEDETKILIKDTNKIRTFENEYLEKLNASIYKIFNEFKLCKFHLQASSSIEHWYHEEMNSTQTEVWEKVFCGGEGLYYTFKTKKPKKENKKINKYLTAIKEIEDKFDNDRYYLAKKECKKNWEQKDIDQVFDSFRTKAFQIGLLMAFDYFKELKEFNKSIDEFLSSINKVQMDAWVYIIKDLRPLIIKGTDPKKWPAYQKIILRILQENDKKKYYTKENFKSSIDYLLFKKNLLERCKGFLRDEDKSKYRNIDYDELDAKFPLNDWIQKSENEARELLKNCTIKMIKMSEVNLQNITKSIIMEELRRQDIIEENENY
ncbi:hypothetical protein GF354_03325 [Candidatus Peregrinibacteria bacterium]|nr:hypothetical protein [Candidatus Peregrinibacteria bacterium]